MHQRPLVEAAGSSRLSLREGKLGPDLPQLSDCLLGLVLKKNYSFPPTYFFLNLLAVLMPIKKISSPSHICMCALYKRAETQRQPTNYPPSSLETA